MSKIIDYLSAALVFALAAVSFFLSYEALADVAKANGLSWPLYALWPVLIDGALIIFSLSVVRASLHGERTVWGWFLVGLFTVATVAFNVIHSRGMSVPFVSVLVAVVPPLALFLSFETLMAMLKSGVKKAEAVRTLADLVAEIAQKRREMKAFETETLRQVEEEATRRKVELDAEFAGWQKEYDTAMEAGRAELDRLDQEIATLQAKSDAASGQLQDITRQVQERQADLEATHSGHQVDVWSLISHIDPGHLDTATRQVLTAILVNAGITQKDISGWHGLSVKTVQRDIAGCNGLIKK